MASSDSCPCGAHVNPAYQAIEYAVDELLPDIIPDSLMRETYLPLILGLVQQLFDLSDLCTNPRIDRPREFTPFDWINPAVGAELAYRWLRYRLYEIVCICDNCPPIATCGGGECYSINNTAGVNTFPESGVWEYQQPNGTWYVTRSDSTCLGPYTGLDIIWHMDAGFDPDRGVCVGNFNGTGYTCWSQNTYSGTVVACTGGDQGGPQIIPWPPVPGDIAPLPGPSPCTTSDLCVVLDYVAEAVREIRFLAEVSAGPLFGVTAPYQFDLPGLNTPITGALVDALPRALAAIAPIQASQLISPTTTPVTSTVTVPLTGTAYVEITPTSIPDSHGYWGTAPTRVYHSRSRSPAPGYALVMGQTGILDYRLVNYDQGVEIAVPSTATELLIHAEPGVTLDITTYQRHV